jgi:hypothetical protein
MFLSPTDGRYLFGFSKTRQHLQTCTLCSSNVSLLNFESSNGGVQCSTCKIMFCLECVRTSSVETGPRMFSGLEWTCSQCYKDNEECVVCESGGSLITCDGCNKDHCFSCADLREENVPQGDWYCQPCASKSLILDSRVRVLVGLQFYSKFANQDLTN